MHNYVLINLSAVSGAGPGFTSSERGFGQMSAYTDIVISQVLFSQEKVWSKYLCFTLRGLTKPPEPPLDLSQCVIACCS